MNVIIARAQERPVEHQPSGDGPGAAAIMNAMTLLAQRWDVTTAEARALQEELALQVSRMDDTAGVEWIAGADVHYPRKGHGRAAAVLMHYPEMEPVARVVAEGPAPFPYIPGLLSFREAPGVLNALAQLPRQPDLLLVDGQGIAHPRRLGIASHLGLALGIPTIGCAKSRLCGEAEDPLPEAGEWAPLMDKGDVIGAVLRSKTGVKPLYVSLGHRVDLPGAIRWVLACGRGYRIPEPLRLAHQLAGAYHTGK